MSYTKGDMINIFNIGSCFAGSVAHCLTVTGGEKFKRICSIQHTRIDQFNRYYVERSVPELLASDIDFRVKPPFRVVLQNQCDDELIGQSLPYGMDQDLLNRPQQALEDKIDVLLIDTFADLLFRAYTDPTSGKMVYIHRDHTSSASDRFIEEVARLSPKQLIDGYAQLFNHIRLKNPKAKAILLNFPINDINRRSLIERTLQIEAESARLWEIDGFAVVDLEEIAMRDLNKSTDPFHFVWPRYFQFSQKVSGLLQMLDAHIKPPLEFRRTNSTRLAPPIVPRS